MMGAMPSLTSNISAISESIFLCLSCSKFPEFFETHPTFVFFGRVEAEKIAKSKVGPILWDIPYIVDREGNENSNNVTPPLTAKLHYQFWSAKKIHF